MTQDAIDLFSPMSLGDLELPNRILMAPMTRARSSEARVPSATMAEYYAQRASAGLIISEATIVDAMAAGYSWTPGLYNDEQIEGWRLVTDAVHQAGGRIFAQLWHVGPMAHSSLLEGKSPVAASAINAGSQVMTTEGMKPSDTPRALETDEIPEIVAQFGRAAENALKAGFDGVELHGANAYLLENFCCDATNKRTDKYGGSIENRLRFVLEVVEACANAVGPDKLGLRISPRSHFTGKPDSDPIALYGALAEKLNAFPLAYLHIIEPAPGRAMGMTPGNPNDPPKTLAGGPQSENPGEASILLKEIRNAYHGRVILNNFYDKDSANAMLAAGHADMVAFGAIFLANPDLPERFRTDSPLNAPNMETFYGGDERGYTDYPTLEQSNT
ncbi:MAG: alkene reductase [Pseudomonadota bacterium]